MKGTIIFRQAIRQALADNDATCSRTYTDVVKGCGKEAYWNERRVCFYNVCVRASKFESLGQAIAEAGGNIIVTSMPDMRSASPNARVYLNIRARVSY